MWSRSDQEPLKDEEEEKEGGEEEEEEPRFPPFGPFCRLREEEEEEDEEEEEEEDEEEEECPPIQSGYPNCDSHHSSTYNRAVEYCKHRTAASAQSNKSTPGNPLRCPALSPPEGTAPLAPPDASLVLSCAWPPMWPWAEAETEADPLLEARFERSSASAASLLTEAFWRVGLAARRAAVGIKKPFLYEGDK